MAILDLDNLKKNWYKGLVYKRYWRNSMPLVLKCHHHHFMEKHPYISTGGNSATDLAFHQQATNVFSIICKNCYNNQESRDSRKSFQKYETTVS
jgi:hypothetical protein